MIPPCPLYYKPFLYGGARSRLSLLNCGEGTSSSRRRTTRPCGSRSQSCRPAKLHRANAGGGSRLRRSSYPNRLSPARPEIACRKTDSLSRPSLHRERSRSNRREEEIARVAHRPGALRGVIKLAECTLGTPKLALRYRNVMKRDFDRGTRRRHKRQPREIA